jgi:hypothetical protein
VRAPGTAHAYRDSGARRDGDTAPSLDRSVANAHSDVCRTARRHTDSHGGANRDADRSANGDIDRSTNGDIDCSTNGDIDCSANRDTDHGADRDAHARASDDPNRGTDGRGGTGVL